MRNTLFIALASLLLFPSCREIFSKRMRGNGNITTENRQAGSFTGVDVSGAIDVIVKQDSTPSIKVEADANLQEYVEVRNEGGILRIKTREGYNLKSSHGIKVYVSAPVLRKFMASGACKIMSENQLTGNETVTIDLTGASDIDLDLTAAKVDADASGASTIKLRGQATELSIDGAGSTDVKCYGLITDNIDIDISGAGSAEVYANKNIKGSISGAASVHYKGTASTSISTSGASSVNKVN